ncbi:MAG: GIY-YIG nuclease family protein [Chloroflexi bacterium]|nr:GIY-YIG nuclease family protein [Chloroflexota bacterium]
MVAWVYILKCSDGSYYVGSTVNLAMRVAQHKAGLGSPWTARRLPVEAVFSYEVHRIDDAFYLERQIKGWRRTKKEALILGRYDLLPGLARSTAASAVLRQAQDGRPSADGGIHGVRTQDLRA